MSAMSFKVLIIVYLKKTMTTNHVFVQTVQARDLILCKKSPSVKN